MKKLSKFLSMALVAIMGTMMVACNEPVEKPEPTPEPTGPSVSVTPGEVGEEWISFTITTSNVKRAFYVAVSEDMMAAISAEEGFDLLEFVLASPNMVLEPNTAWTTTFDGRTPNTKYYVYAAGFSEDGQKVLSECVEMTTLAHEYNTTALPTPDYCNINLTVLSTVDCYAITLTDEKNSIYFTFNIYTAQGCNGAIPAGEYTVSNFVAAGAIDLSTIMLEVNGLTNVISEGTLNVELYDDGANIRLNGTFMLVNGDSVTLEYDGAVTILGIDSGEGGGNGATTVFTVVNNLTAAEGMEGVEAGWHEIQFLPTQDSPTMLNLQFNSDPSKKHLTGGLYPVFDSQASAAAAGMGNSWISTNSFYQENITPYTVVAGMDSYVQVTTSMDSGAGDYYEITFSLKIRSLFDQSEAVLNATYKGALGFVVQEEEEGNTLEMAQNYVSIVSDGNTHTLNFFGAVPTLGMTVVIEGTLPEVGSDYVWYDIVSGTFFDYVMAQDDPSLGNAPLLEGGRIAIKRFNDAADAADENRVKPYYGFILEASVAGWDVVGEWTSFQHPRQ